MSCTLDLYALQIGDLYLPWRIIIGCFLQIESDIAAEILLVEVDHVCHFVA